MASLISSASKAGRSLYLPLLMLAIMWTVQIVRVILGERLTEYGIYPRELDGLRGVLFSPMIHGSFQHLISNSVPFIVLSAMIFIFYRRVAVVSMVLIYLITGSLVWLFARNSYHIGASGVVYGLLAFVFWNGIFRGNLKSIILALVVLMMYSGYFMGIVPNQDGISWESHLIGGLVGIFVSFLFKSAIEKDEEPKPDPWAAERHQDKQYYFQRDIFDKTMDERRDEW